MNEADARQLADAIARDFPRPDLLRHSIWTAPPAHKIIDCVLSLNRKYDAFVVPRVAAFAGRHPAARSVADLIGLIEGAPSPAAFTAEALRFKHASRGAALLGVARYAHDAQGRFEGATEDERLGRWARWARPGDYLAVGVPGFGLAGSQYLRMLFGAETTKPDVHVIRYVAGAVGRSDRCPGALPPGAGRGPFWSPAAFARCSHLGGWRERARATSRGVKRYRAGIGRPPALGGLRVSAYDGRWLRSTPVLSRFPQTPVSRSNTRP